MSRLVITGASGTLGRAVAELAAERGHHVIGVGRGGRPSDFPAAAEWVANAQQSVVDADLLLDLDAEVYLLAAGAIETEIGPSGEPLDRSVETLTQVHLTFPAALALAAARRTWSHPVQVIGVGSIADGSPSAFGPVYHATKAALHQFVSGTAPILHAANPLVRLRLYRPGVIFGEFSKAPMLRLNEAGKRLREKRCASAPTGRAVAANLHRFIDGSQIIGSDSAPLSFRLLQLTFALFPDLYARLQHLAWNRASRFSN